MGTLSTWAPAVMLWSLPPGTNCSTCSRKRSLSMSMLATCLAAPIQQSTSLKWRRLETLVKPTRLVPLTELVIVMDNAHATPTDRDGCDINAYRMGHREFYGAGSQFEVNTEQPFKVVTRFHAPEGVLTGIKQFYVQNGQEIHHPNSPGLGNKNIETDETCAAQKTAFTDRNSFAEKGGMKTVGEALDRGMLLVISMWDDIAVSMNWLDSYMDCDPSEPGCIRGPCDPKDGLPEVLREAHPEASYLVTNLRWGEFGSTSGAASAVQV